MKKSAIELLKDLLTFIKEMEETASDKKSSSELKIKQFEIRDAYYLLDINEKDIIWKLLEDNFKDDSQLYVLLLSILLQCTRDDVLIKKIIDILLDEKLSLNQSIFTQLQIRRYNLLNLTTNGIYELRRILHKSIIKRIKEIISLEYQYRKLEERNQDRIVFVTGTLLETNHAPSKIIMDQIYILQKVLKKEVLLIISPIPFTEENFFTWYQPFIPNYDEKMERKNFSFLYRGVSINGYQLNLCSENLNIYQNLMSIIYDFNPLFIYGHGSYLAWEDVMSQFTTVISKEMSSHYPVSEAQILLGYKGINQNTVQNELDFIKNNKQISFDFNLGIELEKPKTLLTRDSYQIENDDFVIVIVGNRLNEEITNEYAEFLNKILKLHQRIKIAFIGEYFNCPVTEDNKDKIIYLGYQNDLPGAYHIANIYLNPPRKGGGISGLLAIHNGIPVITLPDNDVSNNVGNDFTCNSYDEILKIVLKYMNDESFYESQKQKGFEVTQKLYSEDAGLGQFIEDIKNVIRQAEVGA